MFEKISVKIFKPYYSAEEMIWLKMLELTYGNQRYAESNVVKF